MGPLLLFTALVFGPPPSHPATAWGSTSPKRIGQLPSSHPDQSHPLEPPVIAENAKIRPVLTQNSRSSISLLRPPIQTSKVSRGVGKNYVWFDPSVRVRRQPKVTRCSRRLNVSPVVLLSLLVNIENYWKAEGRLCELHEIILCVLPVVDIKCVLCRLKIWAIFNLQGRLSRNFSRKSRSLVSGPGIGVMLGIPQDSSRVSGNSRRVLSVAARDRYI
ncbi:organic cation/carnitine transporter 3 [Prunus dulcis]|uniref:Organic cation/carnitine transporter 3 n=1 Tax=Prunus dulcis TaxID=3755 RepID=A0A4Y1RSI0_PRUDU|nr:organic cation/carnitine transporter 3 [Prunus dulcis]